MPRRGASRGARALRWSVDLSPAEFAYVEAVRAVGNVSRAQFILMWALRAEQRLNEPNPSVTQARGVLEAERMLLLEEDEESCRDEVGRGGRKPHPRLMATDEVVTAHTVARRQPWSSKRLLELLAEQTDDSD